MSDPGLGNAAEPGTGEVTASVIVNAHKQTWNAPRLAQMNRTCCWPAPTTSLQSRKVISSEKRSPTVVKMSATEAEGSVQK